MRVCVNKPYLIDGSLVHPPQISQWSDSRFADNVLFNKMHPC